MGLCQGIIAMVKEKRIQEMLQKAGSTLVDFGKLIFGSLVLGTVLQGKFPARLLIVGGLIAALCIVAIGIWMLTSDKE
jgi:hypothetical protein